jgi:diacylglycerol kinase family enzyme
MKIPLELEDAIRTIFGGRVTQVDVGEVNGRIFLNNSSLGIYPRLVHLREKQEQGGRAKFLAMARSLVAVMRHYSRLRVRVSPDEKGGKEYDTPLLFVGNNRYEITGLNVGSRTSLDGGTLWVCTAPPASPRELMAIGMRALLNRLRGGDIDMFAAKDLLVSTRHKHLEVSADGEVFRLDAPLRYRSRPKALRVVVPAADASGS